MTLSLPPISQAPRPQTLPAVEVPGLYVHVPFCFHKCHYCDFYSITRQTTERMERFVDLVLREAELWTHNSTGPTVLPRTIFFGGGTPSLLPAAAMRRLIEGIQSRFDLSQLREWTIEVNPATATPEYATMLRDLGVDRLSFGAQSFDRDELKMLERHHDPDDVPRSVEIARGAGFKRLNLDLIYAIPGQTMRSWAASLESVIALKTNHLSCYNLTYEPNTPMAVKKRLGLLQQVEETLELEMLHHARERLNKEDCPPYEISNYAAPGQECLHNLGYWTGEDYIGLGPSAASHVRGTRWKNRPHLGEWEQTIEADQLPVADVETLTLDQRAGELAMLMLRLSRGLVFEDFTHRLGLDARQVFSDQLQRYGKAGLLDIDACGARLTEQGIAVADAVAGEFLSSR